LIVKNQQFTIQFGGVGIIHLDKNVVMSLCKPHIATVGRMSFSSSWTSPPGSLLWSPGHALTCLVFKDNPMLSQKVFHVAETSGKSGDRRAGDGAVTVCWYSVCVLHKRREITSTNPEDTPRGKSFHYDRHRFNVATSRALALCVFGDPT